MAVYDALIVLAWAAVNVWYVQQRVSLILPLFKSAPLPSPCIYLLWHQRCYLGFLCIKWASYLDPLTVRDWWQRVLQSSSSRDFSRT